MDLQTNPLKSPSGKKNHSNRWHQLLAERNKLPIWAHKDAFLKLLDQNDTVVVVGETGSGKTTQIPQWCHEYCKESTKLKRAKVVCTQPRRVAAMSLASRVAEEMDVKLGDQVGYKIRFESLCSPGASLIFMTDGLLLRYASFIRTLDEYGVIILDEAHERTLQTELLLGVVKRAMLERKSAKKPLKIVIMSATINVNLFKDFFQAPVLSVTGRQHSVEIMNVEVPQSDLLTSTLTCVFQILRNSDHGDILVFCAGQDEINALFIMTRKILRYASTLGTISNSILSLAPMPLYASLPFNQQVLVFDIDHHRFVTQSRSYKPKNTTGNISDSDDNDDEDDDESDAPGCSKRVNNERHFNISKVDSFRRVIYSTNIAETSVTIPNISYVIDTGKFKCRQYCPKTGLESLKVTNISRAQAEQRSGRAGRIGPGTCYRLYTSDEYVAMQEFPVPEIKRCNLESIMLYLIALTGRVSDFEFLEKPDDERIKSSIKTLLDLKAIDLVSPKTTGINGKLPSRKNGQSEQVDPTRQNHNQSGADNSTEESKIAPHQTEQATSAALIKTSVHFDNDTLLDLKFDLTILGSKMRVLPLNPSLAKIIIVSNDLGCLDEALTVVSLLSIENLFHVTPNRQSQADAILSKFHSNEGDTIMLLNVYRAFRRTSVINRKGLKQWCTDHFIHIKNLKYARKIRKQLATAAKTLGFQPSSCSQDTSILRLALTYGLFNNVATMWDGKYRSKSSNKEIFIHPSSCLFKARPETILYFEIVETNKCYMRNCTLIDINWIRDVTQK